MIFLKKIQYLRSKGVKHNNIILDPGIGFGKNLKHNITLIRNISIFHSLGFPIMLGTSRKRFIKSLSGVNDSKERLEELFHRVYMQLCRSSNITCPRC